MLWGLLNTARARSGFLASKILFHDFSLILIALSSLSYITSPNSTSPLQFTSRSVFHIALYLTSLSLSHFTLSISPYSLCLIGNFILFDLLFWNNYLSLFLDSFDFSEFLWKDTEILTKNYFQKSCLVITCCRETE